MSEEQLKLIDESDNLAQVVKTLNEGQLSFLNKKSQSDIDAKTVDGNTCVEFLKQISENELPSPL